MTNRNACSICDKLLGIDEMDSLCPECYREWNDDEEGWVDELSYAWPELPELWGGIDMFSEWPITELEEK